MKFSVDKEKSIQIMQEIIGHLEKKNTALLKHMQMHAFAMF